MDNDLIINRCRKVAIPVNGKRIFGEPNAPYNFVTAFRTPELAAQNLQARRSTKTSSLSDNVTVCEFYLVPASHVENQRRR